MQICWQEMAFDRVMRCLFVVVALILATPRWSTAEINMADSIEWTTADSDRVVIGKVAKLETRTDGATIWFLATIAVTETLKGPPARTVDIVVRNTFGDNHPGNWKNQEVLLFLIASDKRAKRDGDHTPAPLYAKAPFALRHGQWGNDAYRIGTDPAYTIDHTVIRKRADLISRVRGAAASKATEAFQIDLPLDSPAGRALYGGSAVFLYVPVDAALEAKAIQWIAASDAQLREQGARALAHFKSAANIARLEKLLLDRATHDVTEGNKPTVRRFFVRKRAHEVLRAWGHPHTTPPIDTPVPNP